MSSIEGTTHDRNGTGLGGITVQLYRYNASTELYEQVDGTSTSDGTSTAAGSYRFTPLESGDYRLQFSHPQGAYLAEYYDDKPDLDSAITISLAEGEHRTGIDAVVMTPDYASWADGYSLLGNDRLGPGDLDGDGFNNSKEYAFGTSPVSADGGLVTCTQSGSNLVITFLARTSGATYTIETTTQLAQTWSDSGIVAGDASDQNNLPANYTRKTATIPISGRAFYRIKAVAN